MSAITGIISGIQGGHAAGQAANAQVGAAQEAAGTLTGASNTANAGIGTATTAGQGQILNAGIAAGAGATAAANTAIGGVNAAAQTAIGGVNAATGTANARLDPYAAAGADASSTLRAGLQAGGDFNRTPTLSDLQMDPGYAFRLQQGQQSLDRSAAAHGGIMSGGNIKDQTNYAQGAASQEYQNAFSRFETSTQNRYGNLMGVSNAGQQAAGQQGQNDIGAGVYGGNVGNAAATYGGNAGINASQYAGNAGMATNEAAANMGMQGATLQSGNTMATGQGVANTQLMAGNARSAGIMGKQNAYTGMLSGIGGMIDNAALAFVPGGLKAAVGGYKPVVGTNPDPSLFGG